jgi:hypothetical protein
MTVQGQFLRHVSDPWARNSALRRAGLVTQDLYVSAVQATTADKTA